MAAYAYKCTIVLLLLAWVCYSTGDYVLAYRSTLLTDSADCSALLHYSVSVQVVYMSSCFWLLAVGSFDLSQDDKELIVVEPWKIVKMKIISTQNGQNLFRVKVMVML